MEKQLSILITHLTYNMQLPKMPQESHIFKKKGLEFHPITYKKVLCYLNDTLT